MESINQIVRNADNRKTLAQSKQLSSAELDAELAKRMLGTQALKKHVCLTPEEIDLHLSEWTEMCRKFSLSAFDEALTRCVRESPYWPDPSDLWKRLYEGNWVDGEQVDVNREYWKEFREKKKAVDDWKNSPEYESDMAALRAKAADLDAKGAELRRRRMHDAGKCVFRRCRRSRRER